MTGTRKQPFLGTRTITMLRLALSTLGLVFVLGASAASALPGCNLVTNSTFENVVAGAQPFPGWAFQKFGAGAYTGAVSSYPNAVQSGAKAAKMVVTTFGDIQLTTVPEATAIPVPTPSASLNFRVSARIKSPTFSTAAINVIEWTQTGQVNQPSGVHWLSSGGSTGDWENIESSFSTHPNGLTRFVSIRLMHHIANGTFYWDDVRLWQELAGQRCFDARHYVTQTTPGERLCFQPSVGPAICIDGAKTPGGEYVRDLTNGIRDYVSHSGDGVSAPLGIGVVKNLDPGSAGVWRCFSEDGAACPSGAAANAQFPAVDHPLMASLPFVSSISGPSSPTPGALAVHGWEPFDVWGLNPVTGAGTVLAGRIWERSWGFFLPSMNFGGNVGTRTNVAVFEYEGIGVNPAGLQHGYRMERYYFVQGLGNVQAEGWEDPDCIADPTPDPISCDGIYNSNVNGIATFNNRVPVDFQFNVDGPSWSLADWWK